ncbi:HET-domain-containing protein, partial [Decorospora gaudefroyi]
MAPKAAIKGRKDSSPSNSSAFKHEDLDYRRGAIRLIRILPQLSKTGLIQCQIWHDNVGAKYDCLSYVWGSESNQKQILINGKTHMVRENLWDFMRVARKKYASPPRTFWIDALCINQGSIPERNHQVAQMGSIYSNAGHVLAWLGLSENISRAFSVVFSPRLFALEDWFDDYQRKWVDRNMQTDMQLKKDWFSVVRNPYWTRAWITQEIYLARNITMLVNDLEVEPKHIANVALGLIFYINDLPGHPTVSQGYDNSALVFATYIKTMCQDPNRPRTQKLVSLLGQLPGRQSLLIHDRVYSLLSIASDTSSITVDYRCSKDTLLRQLLGVYKTSM